MLNKVTYQTMPQVDKYLMLTSYISTSYNQEISLLQKYHSKNIIGKVDISEIKNIRHIISEIP